MFDVLSGLLEAPAHERRQLLERRIVEAGVVVQAAAVGPRRDPRAVRMGQAMLVTLQGMRVDFPSVQATGGPRLDRCAICSGEGPNGPLQALCLSTAATCPTLVHEGCRLLSEGARIVCNGCPARSEPITSSQECTICNERVSETLQCSNGRCVGRLCGPCLLRLFHPSIPAFCVTCESEGGYDSVTGLRGVHNSSQEDPVYGHEFVFGRTSHFEQWLANTQRCP